MTSLILIIIGFLLILIPEYIKDIDNEIVRRIYRNNKLIGVLCIIMGYFIYTDINETSTEKTSKIYMISDNTFSDNTFSNNTFSNNTFSDDYFSSS